MKEKWMKITARLEKTLPPGVFKVWIAPLKAARLDRETLLLAPNSFMGDWLKKRLLADLTAAVSEVLGIDGVRVEIGVGEKSDSAPVDAASLISRVLPPKAEVQAPLPVGMPAEPKAGAWRYSFDDFVTGPSNRVAVAAARELCENGSLDVLYLNSAPGLGKTHLAQAAGQAIAASGNPLKIVYLTADRFASRFVMAMKARELEEFKRRLCAADVLLLEDVHFLQRKKTMQEMILGVIKELQAKGSRVVFTSSFSPRQLRDMDEQLISYFCSGILANMDRPDVETRKEILRRKARSYQVILPDDVCDLVSRRLSTDIRQLESCLKSMIFKARLLNSGLTVELALSTMGEYAVPDAGLDLEGIVELVCQSFGLTRSQLSSRSRRKEYVRGRNTVFYLARKHTDMSLEEIGCVFNRRHSTVMRSITQVERELASETGAGREIARAVSLIERKCGVAP